MLKKKVSDRKRKVERVSGWMRSRDKQTKSPKKKVIQLDHSVSAIRWWWLSVRYKRMSQREKKKRKKKRATEKKQKRKRNGWGWTLLACHFAFLLLLFGVVVVVVVFMLLLRSIYYLHDKGIFVVELLLLVQSIGTKAAPPLCPAFAQVL